MLTACSKCKDIRTEEPQRPASQHAAPPKVKLPPFWTKDTRSWFTLAESTFNRSHVADTRLRFDLVLPALPEQVLTTTAPPADTPAPPAVIPGQADLR